MSNFKKLVRARMEKTGESWQTAARHVRAQVPAASPEPSGAIEVLAFDPSGGQFLEIVWFVPPGLPNGAIDPSEGLIMSSSQLRNGGRYLLVEPTGRARHIRAERGAGGGAYMAVFTEPDGSAALQIVYASTHLDAHGMPATFARYKVIPDPKHPTTGVYAMGVLPLTDGATVKGLRTFSLQAWRELFALLDAAHPDIRRRVGLDMTDRVASARAQGRAGATPERSGNHRFMRVYCDYETPMRAGAGGTFQVIELQEGELGQDVTHLVDQGIMFHELDELRRYLVEKTGDDVDLEEGS
jgi:hypothetical protein